MNVGHPPEVHGQVGRAEVQEVEEAKPQRHAAVTQHLQPVPLAAILEVPLVSAFHLLLEFVPSQQKLLSEQDFRAFIHRHSFT